MATSSDRTPPEGPDFEGEARPLVSSYAADGVALDALTRAHREEAPRCHACDAAIEGTPAGSGLLVWARGGRVESEEPPLCAACATAIGLTALRRWELDDEEG